MSASQVLSNLSRPCQLHRAITIDFYGVGGTCYTDTKGDLLLEPSPGANALRLKLKEARMGAMTSWQLSACLWVQHCSPPLCQQLPVVPDCNWARSLALCVCAQCVGPHLKVWLFMHSQMLTFFRLAQHGRALASKFCSAADQRVRRVCAYR